METTNDNMFCEISIRIERGMVGWTGDATYLGQLNTSVISDSDRKIHHTFEKILNINNIMNCNRQS
jgi:hypothetical protein